MIELNKGTKEEIIVPVIDVLQGITDLDTATPTFDIWSDDDDNDHVVTAQSATNVGMDAHCLIDTTISGFTARAYRLYLSFTAFPELPVLGPIMFRVNSL